MIDVSTFFTSLIFLSIIMIVYFAKKKIANIENRIFSKILILTFLGLSLSIFCYYILNSGVNYDSFGYILINKIILFYYDFWMILFTYYVFVLSHSENAKNYDKSIEWRVNMFTLIIFCFMMVFPLEMNKMGEMVIPSGIGAFFTYLFSGLSIVVMIILLFSDIKNLKSKKYIPLYSFIFVGIICIIYQILNPEVLLLTFIHVIICFTMYFTIENPDIKMIQELQVAREQADKANKAKTDFLSSMSHEIRTPLNAIVGFSDCIMEAESLGEAKENAKDIVSASQTLLEIVNGILDISKIEAGKIEIVNSPYNARDTFNELATLITPKMNEKGLDFTYYIAPDIPETLYGDHANLKKVITNLLSNASKYTEKGFVRYEVNCVNTKGVCKLIISVEDSGRGIKKENVDKMFTKFQRLDEDRNTTIEGTGLGLAITKQLIELMGGKIIVHTVYGEGSKFTVVVNQRIEKVEVKETKKFKTTLDLKDIRILLVDDTALNLKVATKLLQRYNANNVVTCDSGFACLDKIRRGEVYDIILLDDMMPKMSGVETLKKLKEIPGFSIPTVALTANAITGMREKYLADGFNDYLAKPIEKEQLIQVINQILGRSITEEIEVPTTSSVSLSSIPIRDDIVSVTDLNKDDKNAVLPVNSDIEDELGSVLDLSDRNNENTKIKNSDTVSNETVEYLEDDKPVDLIPVASIDIPVNNSSNVDEEKYDKSYLEKNGVDVNHGLELLGDMEMYNMTINDFMEEVESKWERIVEYKNSNNMSDYAIEVHSLKSDCKYLGFMILADIAYQHELKSKENDSNFVNEHFGELEEEYKKVLEIARKYVEHNPVSGE